MSGTGERFRAAGYRLPKPLIKVEGRSIISHVVDMFPGDHEFTFICNNDHLADPELGMESHLMALKPDAVVVGIDSHKKGPGYAIAQIFDQLDLSAPIVINYCDFTCYWDFEDFISFTKETQCDGAIPGYRNFHPHSITDNRYAYVKEDDGWCSDIQEKEPFTDTPMKEFASSGTYYFKSGEIAKKYITDNINNNLNVNGEYYISLPYVPMFRDGLNVAIYELQHFMQWGTPDDLREYVYWSNIFRSLNNGLGNGASSERGTILLPMAGAGARFKSVGYTEPKPLIPVSGIPMSTQAITTWPNHEKSVVITQKEVLQGHSDFTSKAGKSEIIVIDQITEGQASTCSLAKDHVELDQPMTIAPCDSGALYDRDEFAQALKGDADVLVWAMRGYPRAAQLPEQYGWIAVSDEIVERISTKVPLGDTGRDPIVIGAFTFKKALDFFTAADHMYARDGRINGEFYVDECINDAIELGLLVKVFEVDHYLPWGTPHELESFNYWQSCFHKWPDHPYRLENDPLVVVESISELEAKYAPIKPPRPPKRRKG